MRSKAGSPL